MSGKHPLPKYPEHNHKRTFGKKQQKPSAMSSWNSYQVCLTGYVDKTRPLESNSINPKWCPLGWSIDVFVCFSLQCPWLAIFIPSCKPRKESPERLGNAPGSWELWVSGLWVGPVSAPDSVLFPSLPPSKLSHYCLCCSQLDFCA